MESPTTESLQAEVDSQAAWEEFCIDWDEWENTGQCEA